MHSAPISCALAIALAPLACDVPGRSHRSETDGADEREASRAIVFRTSAGSEGAPKHYHSLHWLQYIYLQQGRYRDARELLSKMEGSLAEIDESDARSLAFAAFTHAQMAAAFAIETERWDSTDPISREPRPAPADAQSARGDLNPMAAYAVVAEIPAIFARGLGQAMEGSQAARQSAERLRTIRETSDAKEPFVAAIVRGTEIQELEIEAVSAASSGDLETAIRMLRKATSMEAATPPPPGPPPLLKPSHELLGEILLRAGRDREAAKEFEVSLGRHKDRARSLLGLARSGDSRAYRRFLEQWSRADSGLPELEEANKHTSSR